MAMIIFQGRLHIALEDLKERYRDAVKGPGLIKAYLRALEKSRKVDHIEFFLKDNRTVVFTINGSKSRDILSEVKQDIQGEICSPDSARKYEQPSRYLPSGTSITTKVSEEVCREMGVEDQQRLQQSNSQVKALTMDALEAHDAKYATGPCQLRQFGCPRCQHSWWHNVLRSKPVSRCRGGLCGNQRYDALPRNMEFGIGRFLCPNGQCRRRFFGFCEATDRLQCRKCGSYAKPYIHPKWRKRRRKYNSLNSSPKAFHSQQSWPMVTVSKAALITDRSPSRAESLFSLSQLSLDISPINGMISQSGSLISFDSTSDLASNFDNCDNVSQCSYSSVTSQAPIASRSSVTSQRSYASVVSQTNHSVSRRQPQRAPKQPKIPPRARRRIFNASKVHESTGGTISTFLTQMDFAVGGVEVDLDYDSEEDENKVGSCKFECSKCENEYIVFCSMLDTAMCYNCQEYNRPLSRVSPL